MKVKVLMIPVINLIIQILKYIWVPIIISLRDRSREIVYNYWLNHKIAYHLPNDITRVHLVKDKVIEVYKGNNFLIKCEDISKLKYYFYFYTVYIWIDDTLSADFISDKLAVNILESEYLTKTFRQEINRVCKLGKGDSFNNYNTFDRNNLEVSIGLLYTTLLYNDNNNFKNICYFSRHKQTFLGIGYKKEVNINGVIMYSWSI